VQLDLETNQPIKTAELHIEQGRKTSTIPLFLENGKTQDGPARLTAKVPLDASGTYRVHLISATTGFENKFSPEYEIRVEPDLLPEVTLEFPKHDLILPSNEMIDVQASASDDRALATVSQLVRVNEGSWQETVLASGPGAQVRIERRWDLYEQEVKPGDLLSFKLQAVDLKGNKAESRLLQVTITQAGFEPGRLQTLELLRQVYERLRSVRTAADGLEKQNEELRAQFERLAENDPARKQPVSGVSRAYADFERAAEEASTQLTTALRGGEAGHVAADLVLAGRMLCRINRGTVEAGRDAFELAGADPGASAARDQTREAAAASGRAVQRARLAETSYQGLLAFEEVDVLNENLEVVTAEQERLSALAQQSGDDPVKWVPLAKRLRVVIAETRSIDELIGSCAEHLPGGYGDRLRRLSKLIQNSRTVLEQALKNSEATAANREALSTLAKSCAQLSRDLLSVRRDLLAIKRETLAQPGQLVAQLGSEVQPTYANFDRLQQDLRAIAGNEKLSAEARTHLVDRRWESRIAHFKLHGDLEEARTASDTPFVADLRAMTLALQAMHVTMGQAKAEEIEEKLRSMDKPFRVLESAHNLAEIVGGLGTLAVGERWELFSPRARTTSPRDWEWVEDRMKAVVNELERTELDPSIRERIREAEKIIRAAISDPAARQVNQEMKQRFDLNRRPVAVATDVEKVEMLVKDALDLLRKPISDARAQLAELTPKLDELMTQLAKEAQALKEKTAGQAEKTSGQAPPEAQAGAGKMLAEQQTLNEKLDGLKDALRSEANKQNILEEEGRERARDVDDALAMLKDPPVRAEQALQEASQTAEAAPRQERLENAAEQQQNLADSLNQLAQHFSEANQGNLAQTRPALRATEQQTGVKEQLDAQYARAGQLAEMARKSPEELLAELERALPHQPVMQKELDAISANLVAAAEEKLAKATQQEKQIAESVAKMATEQQAQMAAQQPQNTSASPTSPDAPLAAERPKTASPPAPGQPPQNTVPSPQKPAPTAQTTPNQTPTPPGGSPNQPAMANQALSQAADAQKPIAAGTNEAGESVARAGRHEERLQNMTAGQQLQELGNEISETATAEVPAAQQALARAQSAGQAQPAVNAANAELAMELAQLQQAAGKGGRNPSTPQPANEQTAPGSMPQTGNDSSVAPAPSRGQPASSTPGRGTPAQQDQQSDAQPARTGASPAPDSAPGSEGANPSENNAPVSPQEQRWMARTLDSLDAALHATEKGESSPGMSQAQQGLASTAEAAATAMRGSRGDGDSKGRGGNTPRTQSLQKSTGGAAIVGSHGPYRAPASAVAVQNSEWGKLPKKVAAELNQGQRESVASEYRSQVETYYRVIAEKSRNP